MGLELAGAELGGNFVYKDDVYLTDSQLTNLVKNALTSALQGDSAHYKQLVALMHHSKDTLSKVEVAALVTCLETLSAAVSCIDIVHHRSLLDAIFSISFWKCNPLVLDALVELVISLAASSAKFVDLCLDMLVSNFVPPGYLLESLKQPRGVARKDQVLGRVHSTLKAISDLVPLTPMRLEKIVRDKMPTIYVKEPQLIVTYVENMLKLESGTMGEIVGSSMLSAVVYRLIELDVEIHWDDILQDDFTKGIFDMELEDFEGPQDDFEHDGDELHRENWIEKFFGGNAIAEKLDSLMVVTFEHLKLSNDNGRLHMVFEILLQTFKKTVLTTHKSKFAQFVMFYACSLDPENCGQLFAVTLLNTFLSNNPTHERICAVAYLASYLSRAMFVSEPLVVYMLERVVNWCSDYCKNQDGDSNSSANVFYAGLKKENDVFYAGCQAFMYVLCFRMRSIVSVPRLRSQLVSMRIDEILKHPLNPLKECLPSIVEEFLRVASSSHVFAVPENLVPNGILESELPRASGGSERLDMFFPFDPCLLKKSDRYIRPNFVYWSMVRHPYDRQDDDDDEDSSDEDAANVTVRGNRMMLDDDDNRSFDDEDFDVDDDFDYSLNKMSITPKPTICYRAQMPSRIRPSTSPESL
ncbi:OLC1v1010450C1 [Oldenlandia corymbosa var. corymbosa]|uniref:OLC1v1010450C1 n=1 Tax=Oldenlandia corymbosa var. corymbosa TaxID=529605 RepID=A0AAV1DRZ9_OLDCO|nr:OLC1v1010450C1 [Oldenlandia corymbosa var. corymbosa]